MNLDLSPIVVDKNSEPNRQPFIALGITWDSILRELQIQWFHVDWEEHADKINNETFRVHPKYRTMDIAVASFIAYMNLIQDSTLYSQSAVKEEIHRLRGLKQFTLNDIIGSSIAYPKLVTISVDAACHTIPGRVEELCTQ